MDLELKKLDMFYGTENYYKFFLNTLITDGVKYVCDNGYSWLVSDAVSVIKTKKLNEDFLVIRLKLDGQGGAEMIIDDGNGNVLYRQRYSYTNAKRELKLFYSSNVVMLSNEW